MRPTRAQETPIRNSYFSFAKSTNKIITTIPRTASALSRCLVQAAASAFSFRLTLALNHFKNSGRAAMVAPVLTKWSLTGELGLLQKETCNGVCHNQLYIMKKKRDMQASTHMHVYTHTHTHAASWRLCNFVVLSE